MTSKAAQIAAALAARLAQVTTTGGYETDVGLTVYRGRRNTEPGPHITLYEGEDTAKEQSLKAVVHLTQVYVAEAVDTCDPDNPNDRAHQILSDLKRAVFGSDQTLGGLVKTIEYRGRLIGTREEGQDYCFASIRFAVEYVEDLKAP